VTCRSNDGSKYRIVVELLVVVAIEVFKWVKEILQERKNKS
jgi:hypothetical protein